MKKKLSVAEQLCYVTTRISSFDDEGRQSIGTGFFVEFRINRKTSILLITNKHVIKGGKKTELIFTEKNEDGDPINEKHVNVMVDDINHVVIPHPKNDIDLCAFPIEPIINGIDTNLHKKLFFRTLSEEQFVTNANGEGIDALEEIIMVGYPIGLYDEINNRPIFRRGTTATDPKLDYNGKSEFLIDCACINGSSGSPVFIYNKGISTDRLGRIKIGGTRVMLLGVQYKMFFKPAHGKIQIVNTPTSTEVAPVLELPINLGLVIKAQNILDFKSILENLPTKNAPAPRGL